MHLKEISSLFCVTALLASRSLAEPLSSTPRDDSCPDFQPVEHVDKSWMKDNYLYTDMMSQNHFELLIEVFTGEKVTDFDPERDPEKLTQACLRSKKTVNGFVMYGFGNKAAFECKNATADTPKICTPTDESTNKDWAAKLFENRGAEKPMTALTDNTTYAIQVRCPKGGQPSWYIKSLTVVLSKRINLDPDTPYEAPPENMRIFEWTQENYFNESPMVILPHDECPDFKP